MNNIEIKTDNMTLPDKDQLFVLCGRVLDRITASAPSDSLVNMAVDFDGDDFVIEVEIVSGELKFSVIADARSPFVALERANKEVIDRIKKWSATRQVDVLPATEFLH